MVKKYKKFTSQPRLIAELCIEMFKNIWKMNASGLGGEDYIPDFKVYDKLSVGHHSLSMDIYLVMNKIDVII